MNAADEALLWLEAEEALAHVLRRYLESRVDAYDETEEFAKRITRFCRAIADAEIREEGARNALKQRRARVAIIRNAIRACYPDR